MQYDLDLRARGKPARDLQGGLVAREPYIHDRRERVKAMIRATLRS